MNKDKILITGASGCVGQHISSWLLENSNADLFLWVRDPTKLKAISSDHPRIKLLVGDIRDPDKFSKELSMVTKLIHTATAWGDPDRAYKVNVLAVKKILNLLNPMVIEQIIYFSTASILDKNLEPLPEAFKYGTEYIQTKAECLKQLEAHQLANRIIAVFPTLVFGGRVDSRSNFPTSYLTNGLRDACNWLWLARFLKVNSSFHFIHAADIAFVCGHLSTTPYKQNKDKGLKKMVLAQPHLSLTEAIETLCNWRGIPLPPRIPLWNWLIKALVWILPIEINAWDRYSIRQRHFIHSPITNPETFNNKSNSQTLEEVLYASGLARGK